MSNETMNLFLAPWEIEQNMDVFELYNCKDLCSFACTDEKNAHRFARLPELYDALMKAKNEMFIILNEWALGKSEVEYLATYKEREGENNYEFFNEIQELLRKVRNGE